MNIRLKNLGACEGKDSFVEKERFIYKEKNRWHADARADRSSTEKWWRTAVISLSVAG